MHTPLNVAGDADDGMQPLQKMPPGTVSFMLALLSGPKSCCLPARIRAPLWALSVSVLAFCAAFMLKTFNTALTDSSTLWMSIGYFFSALMLVAGGLMTNACYILALALQHADGGPGALGTGGAVDPQPGATQTLFLRTLLSSAMITPKAAANIAAKRKQAILVATMPAVIFIVIMAGLLAVFVSGNEPAGVPRNASSSSDPSSTAPATPFSGWSIAQELVLFCTGSAMALPSAAAYCGLRLFINIPIIVIVDLIEQSTKSLVELASTPRELAHYDSAITAIQNAHELTVRVAALLGPPIFANIGVWTCFGIVWATAAVAPRTTLPSDSMLNTLFPPWGLLLSTNVALVLGMWPLIEVAQASSACDRLLIATSLLREKTAANGAELATDSESRSVTIHSRVPIVSPEELIRVEGLQRYATELNRSQGFGFSVKKHRVSERYMVRTLIRCISLNVILLCFLAAWDAHTADPNKMVSEYFRVPMWIFYMLWPIVGVFASALIAMVCGVYACRKYRQTHRFVFGDDLTLPWDEETYRQYIRSVY